MPKNTSAASSIGLAIAIGAVAATTFTFWPRTEAPSFYLKVTMQSSLPGVAQLYYEPGTRANDGNSASVQVNGGDSETTCRFDLPEGRYLNLRFDPTDRPGNRVRLSAARIIDRQGRLVRAIPPGQIKAAQQIDRLEADEISVTLTTAAVATDPSLIFELQRPLVLTHPAKPSFRKTALRFLLSFFLSTALGALAAPFLTRKLAPVVSPWSKPVAAWIRAHPSQLVLSVAAFSVVLSCYPIIFFGKSFLSPNSHHSTYLLYGEMPTVPGSTEARTDDEKGSDLGAPMWYSWPTSVVEARSLFRDFELPLWNRYNSSGLPLLGQGQSMFGDPLHLLALLTNGGAGSWDLKYLLAKFLFAAVLGLCVLQLTRHLPAAIIIAASAPFIGFFAFRYSHPAFFSMCYAPLVLLCWCKLIDAPKERLPSFWLGMMVLANWMLMNSGTVKEAWILLLALNACGCLTLFLAAPPVGRNARLRQALLAQALFILIATPVWFTFLHALRSSRTNYDAGGVFQLPPSLLVGLFDDIFYRQFNPHELHFDPSANFLVLGGFLWFCLSWQRILRERLSWGLIIIGLLGLAFVFGVIPPALVIQLPFLKNIYHVDNTFSCVAIICLIVLAGYGIKAFWNDCHAPKFQRTCLYALACLAGLLALYFGTAKLAQASGRPVLQLGEHIPKSAFFWGYSALLVAALAAAPWIARLAIQRRRVRIWQVVSLGLIFILIHWRHGMHLLTPFDPYVMNPGPRTDLLAESPAINLIKASSAEPSRSAGLNYNFFPGYGGAVGVEQIDSVDPLVNKHYKSLMDAYGVMLLFCSPRGGWIDDQLPSDLPLFDMLNVRYFLGSAGTRADLIPSLKQIAALDLNVYESSKTWPRAFFTNRVTPYGAESDFVRLLKEGDGKPFAAIADQEMGGHADLAALTQTPPLPDRPVVRATDYVLTNNTTCFKVTAPEAGVVVLTEPYVKDDFQLRVNGKPADYFRVNSAFRGVFLPKAGDYTFSFSYWPRSLTISLLISAIGIVSLLLWLGNFFKSKSRQA